jgi:hypothetical protein
MTPETRELLRRCAVCLRRGEDPMAEICFEAAMMDLAESAQTDEPLLRASEAFAEGWLQHDTLRCADVIEYGLLRV